MHIAAGGSSQDGKTAQPHVRSVVVYDAASGRVVHTHHAVTFDGGAAVSDEELSKRALKLAHDSVVGLGRAAPRRLEALHVDPTSVAPGIVYRVDVGKHMLIAGGPILATRARPTSKRKGLPKTAGKTTKKR